MNDNTHNNKLKKNKSKSNKGVIKYKGEDPKDPTGSKENISTPQRNSGYDEKQPKKK